MTQKLKPKSDLGFYTEILKLTRKAIERQYDSGLEAQAKRLELKIKELSSPEEKPNGRPKRKTKNRKPIKRRSV